MQVERRLEAFGPLEKLATGSPISLPELRALKLIYEGYETKKIETLLGEDLRRSGTVRRNFKDLEEKWGPEFVEAWVNMRKHVYWYPHLQKLLPMASRDAHPMNITSPANEDLVLVEKLKARFKDASSTNDHRKYLLIQLRVLGIDFETIRHLLKIDSPALMAEILAARDLLESLPESLLNKINIFKNRRRISDQSIMMFLSAQQREFLGAPLVGSLESSLGEDISFRQLLRFENSDHPYYAKWKEWRDQISTQVEALNYKNQRADLDNARNFMLCIFALHGVDLSEAFRFVSAGPAVRNSFLAWAKSNFIDLSALETLDVIYRTQKIHSPDGVLSGFTMDESKVYAINSGATPFERETRLRDLTEKVDSKVTAIRARLEAPARSRKKALEIRDSFILSLILRGVPVDQISKAFGLSSVVIHRIFRPWSNQGLMKSSVSRISVDDWIQWIQEFARPLEFNNSERSLLATWAPTFLSEIETRQMVRMDEAMRDQLIGRSRDLQSIHAFDVSDGVTAMKAADFALGDLVLRGITFLEIEQLLGVSHSEMANIWRSYSRLLGIGDIEAHEFVRLRDDRNVNEILRSLHRSSLALLGFRFPSTHPWNWQSTMKVFMGSIKAQLTPEKYRVTRDLIDSTSMKSRQIATELSAEFNQTRDPKRRRELIRLKLMALGADFKMLAPFIKLASPVDIRTLLSKLRAKHSELKDNRLYGDIISFYGERDLSVYLKQLSGAERLFLNEGLIYRLEDNPTALRRVEALRADLAKDFLAEKSAQSGKLLLL